MTNHFSFSLQVRTDWLRHLGNMYLQVWEKIIKSVSKVGGQLCDSRKSYIASAKIHLEGRQFHAIGKTCKKVQEIVYWCGH